MEKQLPEKESPKQFLERQKRELNDAINRLPECDSARCVLERLHCKLEPYLDGMKPKTWKEVLTRKPQEIPKDLIDILLRMDEIVDAYNHIENYKLFTKYMEKEAKVEESLFSRMKTYLRKDEYDEVAERMTQALKGNEQARGTLERDKDKSEVILSLIWHSPAEIMKLRNDARNTLKSEL
jgi:hypothetical protein